MNNRSLPDIYTPRSVLRWYRARVTDAPEMSLQGLRAYRSAIEAIETDHAALIQAFGGYVAPSPEADPYPDNASMVAAAAEARRHRSPFLVSDVCHGHPLWDDASNWSFRAHHDACHVLSGAEAFTYRGELGTYLYTCGRLSVAWDSPVGLVLLAEILGQAAWFEAFGTFPTADGRQLVADVA